jgi:hypothetical protein
MSHVLTVHNLLNQRRIEDAIQIIQSMDQEYGEQNLNDYVDANGNNLLHKLCIVRWTELSHYILFASRTDVNSTNGFGQTPLSIACSRPFYVDDEVNSFRLVELLSNNETDMNLLSKDGYSTLHYLISGLIHVDSVKLIETHFTMLEWTLQKNPNINIHETNSTKRNYGIVPLHLLIQSARTPYVDFLITYFRGRGANFDHVKVMTQSQLSRRPDQR